VRLVPAALLDLRGSPLTAWCSLWRSAGAAARRAADAVASARPLRARAPRAQWATVGVAAAALVALQLALAALYYLAIRRRSETYLVDFYSYRPPDRCALNLHLAVAVQVHHIGVSASRPGAGWCCQRSPVPCRPAARAQAARMCCRLGGENCAPRSRARKAPHARRCAGAAHALRACAATEAAGPASLQVPCPPGERAVREGSSLAVASGVAAFPAAIGCSFTLGGRPQRRQPCGR